MTVNLPPIAFSFDTINSKLLTFSPLIKIELLLMNSRDSRFELAALANTKASTKLRSSANSTDGTSLNPTSISSAVNPARFPLNKASVIFKA